MSELVETLQDVFELLGPIKVRKMFGGYGIYHQGLMFALIADDALYLKADNENAKYFKEKGLKQFEYNKNRKVVKMSYYLVPDEIMDDREEAAVWASRSVAALLRTRTPKKKTSSK